ncbi:Transforming growth factor beta regulator 1 [Trichinella pseudospiralis]|uniref:Transforming growth factor beta regulator 1 n=1 Tax=Trichinella pseudospiralis TaxID=6337 RepID=A0A0V1FXU4_TRIPS|nr:Transforming growth factor beta regulator 1 [Trichinella pseudospiralis]
MPCSFYQMNAEHEQMKNLQVFIDPDLNNDCFSSKPPLSLSTPDSEIGPSTGCSTESSSQPKKARSRPSGRRRISKQLLAQQKIERKCYLMQKTIYHLVYQNTALCDEISRLHQRIRCVTEERKYLLKRLLNRECSRLKPTLAVTKATVNLVNNQREASSCVGQTVTSSSSSSAN